MKSSFKYVHLHVVIPVLDQVTHVHIQLLRYNVIMFYIIELGVC